MALARVVSSRIVRVLVFIALTSGSAGCAAASVQQQSEASQALSTVGLTQYGRASRPTAATIDGPTLAGPHFTLSSTKENVVVVNVWASWCGPCRAESPALARASVHFAGRPVRFVGIDEQDGLTQARKFVVSVDATYPDLIDSDGRLLAKLRILPQAAVPSTLVLDRTGRIADRIIGSVTQAQITALVNALLTGS